MTVVFMHHILLDHFVEGFGLQDLAKKAEMGIIIQTSIT